MIPAPQGRKLIFDTNVYIEAIRVGPGADTYQLLLSTIPHTYLSAVVLVNDVLLALSARQIGATLYTFNGEDFRLIARYKKFALEVL